MESPHSEIVSAKPPGWPGTRQFGTAGVDATPAVSIGTFGAVTLAGLQSEVDNVAERDVLVLRVDANGAVRWTRSFGSPNSTDAASGVVPLGDGSAIVAGSTLGSLDGTNAGLSDIFLARLDATGTRTWTRQIGTTGSDYGSDIAVDSDGYVYVAGETNGDLDGNTTAGGADAFHTKYDTNGTKISTWQAGGTGVDSASAIAIDSGKNRYLAGRTFSDLHGNVNAGGADVFVSKYNSAGARLWTRQIGTTADDWANDIAVDGGGRVVAVGRSATAFDGKSPQGGIDAIAVCYSAAGVKLWSAQFGSAMNDEAFAVAADRNNNFIVVGYTLGDLAASSAGAQDLFIAKLSSAGLVIWTRQFGTAGDDIAQAVATDPETSMAYVSGTTSEGFDGNAGLGSADSFLIKIGPDGTKQ